MNITELILPAKAQYDISRQLLEFRDCLDIGCGIWPQTYRIPLEEHHLTDPHGPYLEIAKKRRKRDGNADVATWEETLSLYEPNSVDTVFLMDVIEHLEKEDGKKLLQPTINLAIKQMVIFTPLGFMKQDELIGPDPWGMETGANNLQVHRSGWLPEDFEHIPGANIFICNNFHTVNNLNESLPDGPHGAMWVIITKQ